MVIELVKKFHEKGRILVLNVNDSSKTSFFFSSTHWFPGGKTSAPSANVSLTPQAVFPESVNLLDKRGRKNQTAHVISRESRKN
jgi:hypothetical protein